METTSNDKSNTLQINLHPEDSDEFKRLLLKHKSAEIKIFYNDRDAEIKEWRVRRFNEKSNVMHNIRSRVAFRQGNWQKSGITKVEVKINYSNDPNL